MSSNLTKAFLVSIVAALFAEIGWAQEPLALHPAIAGTPQNLWTDQLGKFGESLVREVHRARGQQAFDLNVSEHGIDGLVRTVEPDGSRRYRIIEVKTLQAGTDFQLKDTKTGKQLSTGWIENRLETASKEHPNPEARQAAKEALEQFRANRASVRAELHGISVSENRYIIKAVEPATVKLTSTIADSRLTGMLEELAQRAKSKEVRQAAVRQLAEYDQIRASIKPAITSAEGLAKPASGATPREPVGSGASPEPAHAPKQSRLLKAGGKGLKVLGKAAGPVGMVIGAGIYVAEVVEIENKFARGEVTREQANIEQAKLSVRTLSVLGGATAGGIVGMAIGTWICPGVGTVIGGFVGATAGAVGTEYAAPETGSDGFLEKYLAPLVEWVRRQLGASPSLVNEEVVAHSHGSLEANREAVGAWERFRVVIHEDKTVSFEAHTGFLCAEEGGGGTVVANRKAIGEWEKWTLIEHSDGTISLRSKSGYYLCAEQEDMRVVADRKAVGPWEKFIMSFDRARNTCSLKCWHGKYLSAQP